MIDPLKIAALVALAACSSKGDGAPPPADAQAAQYLLANGETVDCKALRAAPSGEVLGRIMRLATDPADGQSAIETCMADGPHVCDRAWVGWAMFGGLSMAVVDGVAPPIERRARWFGEACRVMSPADQACLVLSARIKAGATADNRCDAPRDRMRAALGHAQVADEAARGPATGPSSSAPVPAR